MGSCAGAKVQEQQNISSSILSKSKKNIAQVEEEQTQNIEEKEEKPKDIITRRVSIHGVTSQQPQQAYQDKDVDIKGDLRLNYLSQIGVSVVCKKGRKPDPNQDDFCIIIDEDTKIYGVFDGHGPYGHDVSDFVHKKLPQNFINDPNYEKDPCQALRNAFQKTNSELYQESQNSQQFDIVISGTTATLIVQKGNKLYAAHVGDSRAVLARKGLGNRLEAIDLTRDHKPTILEEKRRIYQNGGEVRRREDDTQHRVFMRGRTFPGLAMSRSIGDTVAQNIGVTAEPDVKPYNITQGYDLFVLVASDGL